MLDRLADILNIYGKYVINEDTEPRIYHEELGLSQLQDLAIVYNSKVSATVEIPTGKIENVEPESAPDTTQSHAYDDLGEQSLDGFTWRVARSLKIFRQIGYERRTYHEELGLSELQEWAIVYNPKVSATVEIPTGKIENVEPESVVGDNPQSYEQGTDQTYDPNSDAPKKTIGSADDLLKRYGQKEFRKIVTVGEACIFCDSPADRIDAAHAVPWADTKNMHPTNGLPMCKNHHAHYDIGNIIIDWHDGFTVYSQTRQLIPMSETRDRMWYHLDELSQQNNLSLDELLQQQRTHIEANVKKQMEENEWVDEHKWKIYS